MRFKKATAFELARVARDMRAADVSDCAAVGRTPLEAALQHRGRMWVAVDEDNEPLCAFGCAPIPTPDGRVVGSPWLLGTDRLKRHRRTLLLVAPSMLEAWRRQYGTLVNAVQESPSAKYRWLWRMGAEFLPSVKLNGHVFTPFRIQ